MSFARKLKFALDAAKGMLYLHLSNPVILHRDLKSDNLLVTRDWTAKVGDFGLTRFLSEKKAMTQVGTPMWMAPEIIMGKKYTEKADVYAFGIILWEILTRQEPYEEKEPMQIVVEVVNDGLRPTIPREHENSPLVPLMKDCWAQDPDQRPTFNIIVDRIEALFNNETKYRPLQDDFGDEDEGGVEHVREKANTKELEKLREKEKEKEKEKKDTKVDSKQQQQQQQQQKETKQMNTTTSTTTNGGGGGKEYREKDEKSNH